jgi:transposase InsO family protein
METGAQAFAHHHGYYGDTELHQSDNGSEFRSDFVAAVEDTGAKHRYSRPYRKNEQAHIENFNKSLRSECLGDAHYSVCELEKVQAKATEFVHHYIHQRMSVGLPDMMTPAQFQEWHARDPEHARVALEKVYG